MKRYLRLLLLCPFLTVAMAFSPVMAIDNKKAGLIEGPNMISGCLSEALGSLK